MSEKNNSEIDTKDMTRADHTLPSQFVMIQPHKISKIIRFLYWLKEPMDYNLAIKMGIEKFKLTIKSGDFTALFGVYKPLEGSYDGKNWSIINKKKPKQKKIFLVRRIKLLDKIFSHQYLSEIYIGLAGWILSLPQYTFFFKNALKISLGSDNISLKSLRKAIMEDTVGNFITPFKLQQKSQHRNSLFFQRIIDQLDHPRDKWPLQLGLVTANVTTPAMDDTVCTLNLNRYYNIRKLYAFNLIYEYLNEQAKKILNSKIDISEAIDPNLPLYFDVSLIRNLLPDDHFLMESDEWISAFIEKYIGTQNIAWMPADYYHRGSIGKGLFHDKTKTLFHLKNKVKKPFISSRLIPWKPKDLEN